MNKQNKLEINKDEFSDEIKFTDQELKYEEIDKRRWKNRREMAWKSFKILTYQIYFVCSFIIILTVLFIFKPGIFENISKITLLTEAFMSLLIAINFYLAGVIFGYIGGNVIEHIKKK